MKNFFDIQRFAIINNTQNNTVIAGTAEADSIKNYGQYVTINGGDGNDTIEAESNYVVISGDNGNDLIESDGDFVTIISGIGNDTISDFESNNVLHFAATYAGWTTEGDNLIINAAEGSVRINDADGKWITLADGNGNFMARAYIADDDETIVDGRSLSGFEVIRGADNISNQIYAGSGGSSLYGGFGGNDTLFGNSGSDEFVYTYGGGQDAFYNIGAEDSVNINGIILSQLSSAQITDGGITAQFTDGGTLTINGQAGTFIVSGQRFGADYQSKTFYTK